MADFCKQCTRDIMGVENHSDMTGLSTAEDTARGLYASGICEGCGCIQVDHEGNCVSSDCLENGHGAQAITQEVGA